MKLLGFWCLVLGGLLGGAAGYYVALQNQPPSRLPTDIAYTLIADFDLKKMLDEKVQGDLKWKIVKDFPGKGELEHHKKFLQSYKQGSQEHSPQVLGLKTRVIVAQTTIEPQYHDEFWKNLTVEAIPSEITDHKLNVATPSSGGRRSGSNANEKHQEVRTALMEYQHLPGDKSPIPMRGAMHIAMVADGNLVSLIVTMTEVFHTT